MKRLLKPSSLIRPKVACKLIALSLLMTSLIFLIILGLTSAMEVYFASERFSIKCIIQNNLKAESCSDRISNACLAEWLELSCDKPKNLYDFDAKKALENLVASQVIKNAKITRLFPDTLYIEYSLRKPIATLADFTNTYIDEEGICFPALPFYTPKKIPQVRFGEMDINALWSFSVHHEKLIYLCKLLELLPKKEIKEIDLTHLFAKSLGRKEIIITMHGGHILRLNPDRYEVSIRNYLTLKKHHLSKERGPCLIDLRLEDVAFITKT